MQPAEDDHARLSVAGAERWQFTHIEVRCSCGQIAAIPFRLLKIEGRATSETTLGRIAGRMRCHRCGKQPERWRPWYQYIDGSPPYQWGAGHER